MSNSLCFFVGWTWNMVFRDVFMPFAVLVENVLHLLQAKLDFKAEEGMGETAAVLAFVPLATVVILQAKAAFHRRYIKRAHTIEPPKEKVNGKAIKAKLGMKTLPLPTYEKPY